MAYIGNSPFVSGNFSSTTHSGTGSSLGPFAIGQSPGTKNAVLVFIDGVRQVPTIYNVSGSDVTFTAGNEPPLGTDNIQILVSGEELSVNVPADDSIAVDALDTTSAGTTGQFLQKSGAATIDWATVPDEVPTQTGQAGKYLTTDGSATNWGTVATTDTTNIEDDIALLGFKVAANGSFGKYNLVDQTEDAFMDATGIDASLSTGETRNAANYYSGVTGGPVTATGGTITTDGLYTIHSFTSTGAGTFTTDTAQSVDLLVVAGGGGGGGYVGGGGGAGGYLSTIGYSMTAAAHSLTVGTAGAGGAGYTGGNNGGNSQFASMTAAVGGGGGEAYNNTGNNSGGSGGGSTSTTQSAGTAGQGNAGGQGTQASSQSGGGGGGAGAVGGNGSSGGVSPGNFGGDGGVGLSNSITGAAVFYAGGGGGGRGGAATTPNSAGVGGNGGGGTGSSGATANAATLGTDGLGGGGGGGGHPMTTGAHGGSGTVIIRRLTTNEVVGDLTLVSNATTANDGAPTKGDIVMTYTNGAGTATLNTDLTAEFSANDGVAWTPMTLVAQGTTGSASPHFIVSAHNVTLTTASGTAMRYRIKTLNQSAAVKETRIQAVSLGWS